jgi:hypothetical protein
VQKLLLASRFGLDPSLSVKQAAEVVSDLVGAEVSIAGAARLIRGVLDDSDPEDFPSEQAMRA